MMNATEKSGFHHAYDTSELLHEVHDRFGCTDYEIEDAIHVLFEEECERNGDTVVVRVRVPDGTSGLFVADPSDAIESDSDLCALLEERADFYRSLAEDTDRFIKRFRKQKRTR